MKKTIISIALLTVLGTMAVSCQKENITESTTFIAEDGAIYRISYSVDGVTCPETPYSELQFNRKHSFPDENPVTKRQFFIWKDDQKIICIKK